MTTTITIDLTPVPTRQSKTTFAARMDTWLGKITDWTDEANDVAEEVNENAVTCAAGAAAVNAEKWVSGTTYAIGDVTWSPTDYKVYRRKTVGAGTTDPSADGTNWAAISGIGDVITTGEQTLTNKTITLGDNTISGTVAQFNTALTDDNFVSLTGTEALTNKTITSPTITGPTVTNITEEVTALSGTTPEINAGLNTWTLSGASTPTSGLSAGQSALMMIDDGSANTITWPSVTWKTNYGVAPTIETTDYTAIALWKVGSTLYGARVGNN